MPANVRCPVAQPARIARIGGHLESGRTGRSVEFPDEASQRLEVLNGRMVDVLARQHRRQHGLFLAQRLDSIAPDVSNHRRDGQPGRMAEVDQRDIARPGIGGSLQHRQHPIAAHTVFRGRNEIVAVLDTVGGAPMVEQIPNIVAREQLLKRFPIQRADQSHARIPQPARAPHRPGREYGERDITGRRIARPRLRPLPHIGAL